MDAAPAHISLTADELQAVVAAAVRDEIRDAFERVGLHDTKDSKAADDMRDLRNLIDGWRIVRRRLLVWVTSIALGILSLILWPHLKGWLG